MVAETQHRSASSCAQALAAHAAQWRTRADDATSPVKVTRKFASTTERGLATAEMLNEMILCEELFHTPTGAALADFITDEGCGSTVAWPGRRGNVAAGWRPSPDGAAPAAAERRRQAAPR